MTDLSHQQLPLTAPALWVQQKPSLPVPTRGHRNALDHLGRAYTEAQPLAILIGDGKSGASYLIDRFLADIEGDVAVVRITEPCADAVAVMRKVIHAIGFETKDLSLTDLENVFTMFLAFQKTHHRRTIICMEETEDCGRWVLDAVRRLVELETEGRFGLMVILSGRPSQIETLDEPLLESLGGQAEQCIALAPFTLAETREYIRWRIESAGTAEIAKVFEFDAITLIHELSEGVADAVSDLCTKCLQLADEESMAPASTDLVKKAYKLLRLAMKTQQADAEAGSSKVNGVSPQRGQLIARIDGEVIHEQPLNRGRVLIGRAKLCDICLASRPVSRHHALVINSSNSVTIIDLGSTNGTFVDGRLIKEHALQDGCVITVGDCRIEFVSGDDRKGWSFDIERCDSFEPHNADHGTKKLGTLRRGDGKPLADKEGAPDGCNIKGNINSKGDKIYHAPGTSLYNATKIDESKGERWFCSEEEAEAAGWRAPKN